MGVRAVAFYRASDKWGDGKLRGMALCEEKLDGYMGFHPLKGS